MLKLTDSSFYNMTIYERPIFSDNLQIPLPLSFTFRYNEQSMFYIKNGGAPIWI